MLNSPVNPDNDPLVKELLDRGSTMNNVDAGELGLAIQRVIRGENLEDTDPAMAAKYRAFMAAADAASADWDRNRAKVIEDGYNDANMPTEKEAVVLRKQVQERYAVIKEEVRLNSAQKSKFMQDHIKNGPFESLYVEPKLVVGRSGDMQISAVEGQIIGLCGVQLYLEAGQNAKVPTRYAERYRQILAGRKETEARKAILSGKGIDPSGGPEQKDGWEQLADEMHKINSESGSSSGGGEAGDNWLTPDLHQRF